MSALPLTAAQKRTSRDLCVVPEVDSKSAGPLRTGALITCRKLRNLPNKFRPRQLHCVLDGAPASWRALSLRISTIKIARSENDHADLQYAQETDPALDPARASVT